MNALGLRLGNPKRLAEGLGCGHDPQVGIYDQKRCGGLCHQGLGKLSGVGMLLGCLLLFRDFKEGDAYTVDSVVFRAIGAHGAHVPAIVFRLHLSRDRDEFLQHRLGIADQARVVKALLDVLDRSSHIRWDEMHELRRGRHESSDSKLPVEKDDRDIRAHQEVVEIGADRPKLDIPVLELPVDRDHLLIQRLELLLGGLELLVVRLQLFVERQELFVAGAVLPVGALELLDRALQLLPEVFILCFELANERLPGLGGLGDLDCRRVRDISERDQKQPCLPRKGSDRLDRTLHALGYAVTLDPHVGDRHALFALPSPLESSAKPRVDPRLRPSQ